MHFLKKCTSSSPTTQSCMSSVVARVCGFLGDGVDDCDDFHDLAGKGGALVATVSVRQDQPLTVGAKQCMPSMPHEATHHRLSRADRLSATVNL